MKKAVLLLFAAPLFAVQSASGSERLPRVPDSLALSVAISSALTCDDLMEVYDYARGKFIGMKFLRDEEAAFTREVILDVHRSANAKFLKLHCSNDPVLAEWLATHDLFKE